MSMHSAIKSATAGILGLLLSLSFGVSDGFANGLSPKLRTFLQEHFDDKYDDQLHATAKVVAVEIKDKRGNTFEILVYAMGPSFCGSGGCVLLMLRPTRKSYKVLGETLITRCPIRKLQTYRHGLPELGVWVEGGGEVEGFEAILPFDGKSYPRSPFTPPARKAVGHIAGRVLIDVHSEAVYLYH